MKSCFKVLLSWDKANVFTCKILLIPGFSHICIVVMVLVRSKLLVFHDSCLSNSFFVLNTNMLRVFKYTGLPQLCIPTYHCEEVNKTISIIYISRFWQSLEDLYNMCS
jgi:hypothetical protein